MNARTIRRAQERRANKQARKAALEARKAALNAEAQLATGRANAQVSAEPASETGQPKSCPKTQAVTGLTGGKLLLPSDEADSYSRLIAAFVGKWQPVGEEEQRLVQS
ncbi:MAG: hypothetical protein JOZ29_15260, partial [Deltaproteobacteria bacterium]|nr:hypothetical protein [Deltaproteobacteria bacterium]